jgi:hypothetical protein
MRVVALPRGINIRPNKRIATTEHLDFAHRVVAAMSSTSRDVTLSEVESSTTGPPAK